MLRRRGSVTVVFLAVAGLMLLLVSAVLAVAPLAVGDMSPLIQGLDQGIGQELAPSVNGSASLPSLLYPGAPLPSDYSVLANYTLQLINQDRSTNGGLSAVSLDPPLAAQQHAYSMLVNDYLSHWDTQGLKPYMRYTIEGGQGSVDENVAFIRTIGGYGTTSSVEEAITTLEYQMVYNDTSHNNGHRDNILDPYHTGVSIGIAYDSDDVYLVEDFTNDYLNWTAPITMTSTGTITFSANFSGLNGVNGDGIQLLEVFYDPMPTSLTSAQLAESPYNGDYTQGTFVAGVVPPGYQLSQGTTVTASPWDVTQASISLAFNLGAVMRSNGPGVYTLYLEWESTSGREELLTSYSLFVDT